MSEKAKQLIVVFVGVFVIAGVVTLQIRRARPAMPIQNPPAAGQSAQAETAPPTAPVVGPAPRAVSPAPLPQSFEAADAVELTEVPLGEWGRNPFLTPMEIAALQPQPEPVETIELPLPPAPEPTRELPAYRVTVIMSGDAGPWAVVDARVVRPGDQLGEETVREITNRGVVLEMDGETRLIRLERPNPLTRSTPPKE